MSIWNNQNKRTSLIALLVLAAILVAGAWSARSGALAGTLARFPAGDTARQADPMSKIEQSVLAETADGGAASIVILLSDQADVNAGYNMKDQDARGWYVYNTLKNHADRTQAGLRAYLTAQGIAHRSFWAANMIVAEGVDRAKLTGIAMRADVGTIESNRPSSWIEDDVLLNGSPAGAASPDAIEWGVQNVNAPQVWAMGFTGQGMVVGNQDTGMRWTHNAIKPKYRGWDGATANHNYNWWDAIHSGGGPCGPNSQVPCDDNAHGTHTTGTTVGDDGNPGTNQIGVAPGAKWIGCRNMDQGVGTPATYTECFQFFIAPTDLTGQNPNPTLRPHVMNNSWGCPPSEGCAANTLEAIVNASQAAGIFVVVSAGNSGSGCSTVSDPPAIYEASFSVGAINITNNLAGFSSRGPVTVDGSGRMKPNISAPGVAVRSSTNGGDTSYASFQGTSMAGPHVVGVVAVLWSARPALVRDIAATKTLLQNTANPQVLLGAVQTCGGIPSSQIPNNSFGYGRVDLLAAVNASGGGGTPSPVPPSATPIPPTATTEPPAPTNTPGSVATATPVAPTPCTIAFNDVPSTNPFYVFIRCLACRQIVSGYSDGTFRWGADVTRGQLAKIISGAAGQSNAIPSSQQTFADVPNTNTFWLFVERLSGVGAISGYACGGAGEPCDPSNRPYFRWTANATRGQISKITAVTAGYNGPIPTSQQTFTDVPPSNAFWTWIEELASRSIISGYACGGAGEPCDPSNRPYFRWTANATRGQMSKIGAETFFPNCQTPQR